MERTGYNTKARRYILDFLKDHATTTVSAADIVSFLRENKISVNCATVYRYLNKLAEEKRVVKVVSTGSKGATYQLSHEQKNCEQHLHIKCVECGKLVHLECGIIDELKSHLLKDHGFGLECNGSILYGECEECRKQAKFF